MADKMAVPESKGSALTDLIAESDRETKNVKPESSPRPPADVQAAGGGEKKKPPQDSTLEAALRDVNNIVPIEDDPTTPVNTFRAWFIGLVFSVLGAGINNFFAERLPGIALSGFVAQLIAYPAGKFCEKVLPTRVFTVPLWRGRSWSFSLNPGSFNAKEHMLITVFANVSFGGAYATSIIITQRLERFYNQAWAADWGYMILLTMSTQIIGYGLAGLARASLVWSTQAIWPGSLAVIALNRSFHSSENDTVNDWRITRLRFFGYVCLASGLYYIIPNYIFGALSQFSWMTWIAPDNAVLAALTGSVTGIGINPLPTFDWNMVTGMIDPIITPIEATMNFFGGMLFMGLVILPAIWFSNTYYSAYLPIVSNRPFDNQAKRFNVTRLMTPEGRLDVKAYESYSPVYLSAANALTFAGYFALYPATIVYAACYHGQAISEAFKGLFTWLPRWRKQDGAREDKTAQSEELDIHRRLMQAYPEVPQWWYASITAVGVLMSLIMLAKYPTDMPVWGVAFALVLGAAFVIPIGLITAVSNVTIGLNVLSELIVGFALPGRPLGMMIFKTYSTITLAQAISFVGDLKVGHYCKIPPRTMFAAQLIGTVISVFMTLFVTDWQIRNIKDFCALNQAQKFSCPGATTFFGSSIIFGLLGPAEQFGKDGLYSNLLWGFPIGLLLPLPIWWAARRWPTSKWLQRIHLPVILAGTISYGPLNLTYITAGIPVAYYFNVHVKRRFYGWWQKYAYVFAVAMGTGIAISGLFIFVALQNTGVNIDWVGNNINQAGCDAKGCSLITLKEGEVFGPKPGEYKYN